MTGKTSKWFDLAGNDVLRELTLVNQAALLESLRCRQANTSSERLTEDHALDSAPKQVKKSKRRSTREDAESTYENNVSLEMPNDSSAEDMFKTTSKKKRKKDKLPKPSPMEEDSNPGIQEFQTFLEVLPECNSRPRTSPKKRKTREESPNTEPLEPRSFESLIGLDLVPPHESNPRHSSKKKEKEKGPRIDPAKEDVEPSVEQILLDRALDLGLPSESNPSAPKKKKSFGKKPRAESSKEDAESTPQSLVDLPSEIRPNSKPACKTKETSEKKPKASIAKSSAKATKPRPRRASKDRKAPLATYIFQRQKVPALIARAEELLKKWKEPIPPKGSLETVHKRVRAFCTGHIEKAYTKDSCFKKPTNSTYVLMELRKSLMRHDWPGTKKLLQLLLRSSDLISDRLPWKIMMILFMNYPGAETIFRRFVEQNRCTFNVEDILYGLVTINGLAPFTKRRKLLVSFKVAEEKSKEILSQGLDVIPDKV